MSTIAVVTGANQGLGLALVRGLCHKLDILINAVCPGLVDTDASRPWFSDMSKAQSPDQAATDVVWLATLPRGTRAPYGELVRHQEVVPFAVKSP